ncbi:MAG: chromosomal replication initiator protein DnaA [Caldilineaceae bacterium]|nr:chromosomal replication initiator protein DnaA [Caldilineaceae bacterium]
MIEEMENGIDAISTLVNRPASLPGEDGWAGEQNDSQRRAMEVWQMALNELALSMPAPTFETWVRDTSVLGYEDGEFVIGVPHAYARDWLQNRLRPQIKRILARLLQRSVEVTFRVRPRPLAEPEQSEKSPLYQKLGSEEPGLDGQTLWQEASQPTSFASRPNSQPANQLDTQAASQQPARRGQGKGDGGNAASTPDRSRGQTESMRYNQQQSGLEPHSSRNSNQQRNIYASHRTEIDGTPLNPHYTFSSFVVGSHNRLAHAAALSVAEQPGFRFNPLFVYGGVGLGKTHLLHAIGHQMLDRGLRVLYCSSEQFTNELISGIRSQSTEEFRNKYRQVDLLLIDDIQFIGGKESTQEEFFHTFNHLHAANRQVVISSDRPPKEIATLEARLRSRFEGGLQADISIPDLETRVAILQSKALAMGARVEQEVLMLVAERVDSNIRELEGALNRLIVQSPLYHDTLNRQNAEEILNDLMPQRRPREASSVIQLVASHFNLSVAELLGRGRTKEVAFARQIAMYLLREENNLSLPGIGDQLGGRDHSTVRYGVEKVINDMETDETTRRHVITLREKVYAPPGTE